MSPRRANPRRSPPPPRGLAAVVMIVIMLVVQLSVLVMVLGGSRDQELTNQRLDTICAFYAAEGGMNMALREIATDSDEDGDGVAGTISDDANDATDPGIGDAKVVVTTACAAGVRTHTSRGRAGICQRRIDADVE